MLSISSLFELSPKVDVSKVNQAYFKKIFAVTNPIKRQKLMKAQMKFHNKVLQQPTGDWQR
jgi:hypothetical protein